jgi:hypothetical protein
MPLISHGFITNTALQLVIITFLQYVLIKIKSQKNPTMKCASGGRGINREGAQI